MPTTARLCDQCKRAPALPGERRCIECHRELHEQDERQDERREATETALDEAEQEEVFRE